MSRGTAKLFAEMLSQRLGIASDDLESTIGDDPVAAALALSLMNHTHAGARSDATATVKFVAGIVGACRRCLGEDAACDDCGGAGRPGSRQPDGEALIAWIARPLRRLGLCVATRQPERAAQTPGGGYSS